MFKKRSISKNTHMTHSVFRLAADGKSEKAIARELGIFLFEVNARLNSFNEYYPTSSVNENVKPGKLFDELPQSLIDAFKKAHVTPRQGEVLYLAARGWSNKGIGNLLEISTRTAEVHRFNGQTKIGARNVADTLRFVMKAAPSLLTGSKCPECEL